MTLITPPGSCQVPSQNLLHTFSAQTNDNGEKINFISFFFFLPKDFCILVPKNTNETLTGKCKINKTKQKGKERRIY